MYELTKPLLKLNLSKWIYIGCLPKYASPEAPSDQSRCTLDECQHCNQQMWLSEKKRLLKKSLGKKARVYCLECLARAAHAQGLETVLYDIGDKGK